MKVDRTEETTIVKIASEYVITLSEDEARRLAFVLDVIDWSAHNKTSDLCMNLYLKLPSPGALKLHVSSIEKDGDAGIVTIAEGAE